MSARINVVQVIQSRDESNPPVNVSWGTDVTPINAASSVAQILNRLDEGLDPNMPKSIQYRTLSVSITFDYTDED